MTKLTLLILALQLNFWNETYLQNIVLTCKHLGFYSRTNLHSVTTQKTTTTVFTSYVIELDSQCWKWHIIAIAILRPQNEVSYLQTDVPPPKYLPVFPSSNLPILFTRTMTMTSLHHCRPHQSSASFQGLSTALGIKYFTVSYKQYIFYQIKNQCCKTPNNIFSWLL